MTLPDYLLIVAKRLAEAEEKLDYTECVRLVNLLIDTAKEYREKCEQNI